MFGLCFVPAFFRLMFYLFNEKVDTDLVLYFLFHYALLPFCVGYALGSVPNMLFGYSYDRFKKYSDLIYNVANLLFLSHLLFKLGGEGGGVFISGTMVGFVFYPRYLFWINEKNIHSMCGFFDHLDKEEKDFICRNFYIFFTDQKNNFLFVEWVKSPIDKRIKIPNEFEGKFFSAMLKTTTCLKERRLLIFEDSQVYGRGIGDDYETLKRRRRLEEEKSVFLKKWGFGPEIPEIKM